VGRSSFDVVLAPMGENGSAEATAHHVAMVFASWRKHMLPVPLLRDDNANLEASAGVVLAQCATNRTVSGTMWTDQCLRRVLVWPPTVVSDSTKHVLILRDPRATTVSWFHFRSASLNETTQLLRATRLNAVAISLRYVAHVRFTATTLFV
jgi:hypothetical protein